jgi:hypothetical protein
MSESLQKFATVIDHLVYYAHNNLPKHCFSKEAARALADWVKGRDMR